MLRDICSDVEDSLSAYTPMTFSETSPYVPSMEGFCEGESSAASPYNSTPGRFRDINMDVPKRAESTLTDPCEITLDSCTADPNDYYISTSEAPSSPHVMIKDPKVGDIASYIREDQWHESRFVDLTTEMKAYKPGVPWSTANGYYELEYKLALLLLKPTIGRMPGGEYFGEMLFGPAIPKSWNAYQRPFPPETKVLHESIPSYGTLHHCDHYRSSGCEVKLRVIRQHARFPGQDLFQCSISKGWHRHACNHRSTKNVKKTGRTEGSVPAAHPMIDIFCRNHCKERKGGDATPVFRHIQTALVSFLRKHPVLHCEYPHADDDFDVAKDGQRGFCLHARTHEYISSLKRFERAADMPPTEPVDVVLKSRSHAV